MATYLSRWNLFSTVDPCPEGAGNSGSSGKSGITGWANPPGPTPDAEAQAGFHFSSLTQLSIEFTRSQFKKVTLTAELVWVDISLSISLSNPFCLSCLDRCEYFFMVFNFANKHFALFCHWRQWRWHCVVSFIGFAYLLKLCYSFCLYSDGFISILLSHQITCGWCVVLNQVSVSKFGLTWMNHHLYKLCTYVSFSMAIIQRTGVEMKKLEPHSRL